MLGRHRLDKLRVLGKIRLTADDIGGNARDESLLSARRVELGDFGDGRDLTQQPDRIEAPLVNRAGAPRQLCHPAHLPFDLLDELSDLGGSCTGLLALGAEQQRPLLAIGKPHIEEAAGHQSHGHHRNEQRNILAEELAPGPVGDLWLRV